MNSSTELVTRQNYSFQETWDHDPAAPEEYHPGYGRSQSQSQPQRKPVSTQSQYELLQPPYSATTEPEQRGSRVDADHTISHIPNKRSGGWFWEAVSFAVAVACYAGTVGMLAGLSNRQVPTWPAGLSVNAVLSVIVTVMKGAMGVCVAECLSQIKWTWFKRHRKLIDLVIIDEASRGILGAGRLLFTLRAWYLAYLGSFIFLAAFLIGPTVQQMVEVKSHMVDLPTNATVPICNNSYYEVIGLGAGPGLNRVNIPMVGSMYDGFLQTSTQQPLKPDCPTGNCTYPRYQSLGLCHECTDYSDRLNFFDPETNETMPTSVASNCSSSPLCYLQWPGSGLSLGPYGMINSTIDYNDDIDQSLISTDNSTISTFRAVMSHAWESGDSSGRAPVAVQCLIRFCIKTYEASVDAGSFTETVVATSSNDSHLDADTYFNYQNHLIIPARPCYVNGTEKLEPWNDQDRAQCVYNVSGQSGLSLGNTFGGLTTGEGTAIVSNRPDLSNDVMWALVGLINAADLGGPDLGSFKSVNRAFQSVVNTVTNQARSSVDNCGGAVAHGIQRSDELYINIRWIWLMPTTIVLAICLVFFLATIVQSWREDLWKSSPLAYFVHRPKIENMEFTPEHMVRTEQLEPATKLSTIEKVSHNFEVRFERRI